MLSSSTRLSRRAFLSATLSTLALAGGAWPLLASAPPAADGQKYALLIGIDDYQNLNSLHAAANDAHALAQTLKEVGGFTSQDSIRLLVSDAVKDTDKPTRNNILTALALLSRQAKAGDTVYVMCFCHGIKDRETDAAYILPSDTNANDEVESALAIRLFRRKLDAVKPRVLVFAFDMCLTEPTRGTDPKPLEKAVLAQARGAETSGASSTTIPAIGAAARFTTTLFGCSEGQSCWESKNDGRGYFSLYLEKGLRGAAADKKTGEVTLDALRGYVKRKVKDAVFTNHNAAQEPSWDDKSEGSIGPLVLARVKPGSTDEGNAKALITYILDESHDLLQVVDENESLLAYAVAQATSGDMSGARETFKQVNLLIIANVNDGLETARAQSQAFLGVVVAQVQAGDISGAEQTAATITDAYYKFPAFRAISIAQATTGDANGARKTLSQAKLVATSVGGGHDTFLSGIAEMQAKAGDVSEAKQTAALIDDSFFKALAFCYIGGAQIKAGDNRQAKETLIQARQTFQTVENTFDKTSAFSRIVEMQARAGDVSEAKQTSAMLGSAHDKSDTFAAIAIIQVQAGNARGARETLTQAILITAATNNGLYKADALSRIAEAQVKAGDVNGARATLTQAKQIAAATDSGPYKANSLSLIAEVQAAAGDVTGALETLSQAKRAAGTLGDARAMPNPLRSQTEAFSSIAVAQVKAGDIRGARETARSIKNPNRRVEIFCKIVAVIMENEKAAKGKTKG